jgi:hypothetical protein
MLWTNPLEFWTANFTYPYTLRVMNLDFGLIFADF